MWWTMSNEIEIMRKIAKHMIDEKEKGKIPLIIIGAGASAQIKVPTMEKMIEKLDDLSKVEKEKGTNNHNLDTLITYFDYWRKNKDRSIAARIFRELQSNQSSSKKIWDDFGEWLLKRCIDEENQIGILKAPNSPVHEKIVDLYEKGAICISLNFDGLMRRHLNDRFQKKDVRYRHKAEDLEDYFIRNGNPEYKLVIKLRGDVFHAVCKTSGTCIHKGAEIPLWDLTEPDLTCPECEEKRSLYISFPGMYEKEIETRKLLSILWRYIIPRTSCILIIGVSGNWDPSLVAFLSSVLTERDIPLININDNPSDTTLYKQLISPNLDRNRCSISREADDALNSLLKEISQYKIQEKKPKIDFFKPESDYLWSDFLSKSTSDFEQKLINTEQFKNLLLSSQIGLKSKWLGVHNDLRKLHKRYYHSLGVMLLSSRLYEFTYTNSKKKINLREKQFLRTASLLHDIGHLPFSHLLEDIFKELNWKITIYEEPFTHTYNTIVKIENIFNGNPELKSYLDSIGYSVKDIMDCAPSS